jgi:DNA-binding MarR family transcriptional regulator
MPVNPPSARHPEPSGPDARATGGERDALKLWLRLLACSTALETEVRRRLRARFQVTLSRFDYMAQLYRYPEGLRMNELSRHLMVTGGNVTGLTDELEKLGWVQRHTAAADRRACVLTLTAQGRNRFQDMAREHEAWVTELLGGLRAAERRMLHDLLGRLRETVALRTGEPP